MRLPRTLTVSCRLMAVVVWAGGVPLWAHEEQSPAAPTIKILTQEQILGTVWNHFLGALGSGDSKAIRLQCTAPGFQSLISRMDRHKPLAGQWRQWSQQWSLLGAVRWQSITSIVAYGRLGPAAKEQAVSFVLTPQGWKLDSWSPAD